MAQKPTDTPAKPKDAAGSPVKTKPSRRELQQRIEALKADVRRLRAENKATRDKTKEDLATIRAASKADLAAMRDQHRSERDTHKQAERNRVNGLKAQHRKEQSERVAAERVRAERSRRSITNRLQVLRAEQARLAPIRRILEFARACIEKRDELSADIYVAHEVLPLTAMHMLADATGGGRFCNAVEYPSFRSRAMPSKWPDDIVTLVDQISDGGLGRCDALLTTGRSLAEALASYNVPTYVIENFRNRETLKASTALRERCGLGDGDRLLLSIGHLASGVEPLLHALTLLPNTVHFASLGPFAPIAYEDALQEKARDLGVLGRVHFLPSVPYSELTSVASSADCGVIARDSSALNNAVSFPNRVFDFTAAGLPIVAPDIPDIARFIADHGHGRVLSDSDPESWAAAITETLGERDRLRAMALKAAETATWESLEPRLLEAFGDAASVTFLGVGDLAANNRTRRMARTLAEAGREVRIASGTMGEPTAADHPNISFHTIPRLTPTGTNTAGVSADG